MPTTSNTIANEALQLVGDNDQKPVTGEAPTFDNSTAGVALQLLYAPAVAAVARQYEWDFARKVITLVLSGNAAPFPWAFEYSYPPNGIQVWTLMDVASDPLYPLPTSFDVGNTLVATQQVKVIHTDLANARAVFNNNPLPDVWDPLFHQAVVRLLASALAMALAGKPDVAQSYLETGGAFETLGEGRQN